MWDSISSLLGTLRFLFANVTYASYNRPLDNQATAIVKAKEPTALFLLKGDMDLAVLRRDVVGAFLISMYIDGDIPTITIDEIASKMDQRIIEALQPSKWFVEIPGQAWANQIGELGMIRLRDKA